MKIDLTGTLLKVNQPKQTKRGSVWTFVLQVSNGQGRSQTYIISAFSDQAGQDPFGLMDYEARTVAVTCYLNGNEYPGKNGPAYINELRLVSIKAA